MDRCDRPDDDVSRALDVIWPLESAKVIGAVGRMVAARAEDTDWSRIVASYDALAHVAGTLVVELNRAVAVSMASGPAAAIG